MLQFTSMYIHPLHRIGSLLSHLRSVHDIGGFELVHQESKQRMALCEWILKRFTPHVKHAATRLSHPAIPSMRAFLKTIAFCIHQ
jgi:hypothetical protein